MGNHVKYPIFFKDMINLIFFKAKRFFELQSAGGILLALSACLALVFANVPQLAPIYDQFLHIPVEIKFGTFELKKDFLLMVNDGLMAIFFLLVAMEIKREIIGGSLSNKSQIVLPGVAALGGVLVPALIYYAFNMDNPQGLKGWAIPTATDIAFSLGVLSLLGKKVPTEVKIFLTTVAVIDDLVAIIVIAIFYTNRLSLFSLMLGGLGHVCLLIINRSGVKAFAPYIIIGTLIWVCVLKSGIHATLAGVIVGFAIPYYGKTPESRSPLKYLEHVLHPWVAFLILPLFAFTNSGINFSGLTPDLAFSSISMGIFCGLVFGKPIGIYFASKLMIKLGYAQMPGGVSNKCLLGVACLAGIGFTMSLFIGMLAFESATSPFAVMTRLGVFSASIISAIVGYLILNSCFKNSVERAQ
jgi:Na+:H+ antiporter, NhaA family